MLSYNMINIVTPQAAATRIDIANFQDALGLYELMYFTSDVMFHHWVNSGSWVNAGFSWPAPEFNFKTGKEILGT